MSPTADPKQTLRAWFDDMDANHDPRTTKRFFTDDAPLTTPDRTFKGTVEIALLLRGIIRAKWAAIHRCEFAVLEELFHDDAVQEWPQSGERVVGKANILAVAENYPGLPLATVRRITGAGRVWISEELLNFGGHVMHG